MKLLRVLKKILSNIHRYILWALLSIVIWSFVFTRITDTAPEKKVTVFAHTPELAAEELSIELEKALPEGIKMIKVHSFGYSAFGSADIEGADIFIMPEREVEKNLEQLLPVPVGLLEGVSGAVYESGGQVYGFLIYDGASKEGRAKGFIGYEPIEMVYDENGEPHDVFFDGDSYYLCFGAGSVHMGGNAEDNAALSVAGRLINLP